jgi:hypothetical protein
LRIVHGNGDSPPPAGMLPKYRNHEDFLIKVLARWPARDIGGGEGSITGREARP